MVRTLQPYETLAGGADEILDFPNPLSSPALFVGSLTVTADGPGLIGDLLFGDARNGKYLTAYSLQQRAGTRSYFAHFAEGLFGDPPGASSPASLSIIIREIRSPRFWSRPIHPRTCPSVVRISRSPPVDVYHARCQN